MIGINSFRTEVEEVLKQQKVVSHRQPFVCMYFVSYYASDTTSNGISTDTSLCKRTTAL